MIGKILNHPELQDKPPVLVDVGSSGDIHKSWKKIIKYSICIAFDADDREMNFTVEGDMGYKKLILFNKIVSDEEVRNKKFYLTKSPFCSSTLEPDKNGLNGWAFEELFKTIEIKKIDTITINRALDLVGLDYIDWFKTDSQGTDLRIFKSIDKKISNKLIVAEFEPGIINAYKGEDKMTDVMSYLSKKDFFMANMEIKGTQRININNIDSFFPSFKNKLHQFRFLLNQSPCWAELTYINSFNNFSLFSKRDFLVGILFSLLHKQFGHAIHLAQKAGEIFEDKIFEDTINYCAKKIRPNLLFYLKLIKSKIFAS